MDQEFKNQIEQLTVLAQEAKDAAQVQHKQAEELGAAHGQAIEEVKNRMNDVDAKLKVIEKKAAKAKAVVAQSNDIEKEMKSVNDHLAAVGKRERFEDVAQFSEVKSLVEKAIRKGDRALTAEEYKSINTVINPDGGYLVAPQVDQTLYKKVFDSRQVMGAVTTTQIGTDTWKEFIDYADYNDGVWEDQLSATGSDLGNNDFKEITISAGEMYYPKKFSRTALEDSFVNLDTEVMGSVQRGNMRKIANGILNGAGTTEDPIRGLLTYDAGTNWGQIEQVTSAVNDAFTWDDVLEKLPAVLPDDFQASAQFAMKRATFLSLLTAKDSNGKYQIGNQINFFDENLSLKLMGHEVLFDAGMPAVADGSLPVLFGDLAEAYRLVRRVGFSIHRNDSNAKFITLTGRERAGGACRQFQAVKILKIQ